MECASSLNTINSIFGGLLIFVTLIMCVTGIICWITNKTVKELFFNNANESSSKESYSKGSCSKELLSHSISQCLNEPKNKNCYVINNNSHKTIMFRIGHNIIKSSPGEKSSYSGYDIYIVSDCTDKNIETGMCFYHDEAMITTSDQRTKKEHAINNIIIDIKTDPYWFVKMECNVENVIMSMVLLEGNMNKNVGTYVPGVSHILTPNRKKIKFREVSEGATSDGYKFVLTHDGAQNVTVKISARRAEIAVPVLQEKLNEHRHTCDSYHPEAPTTAKAIVKDDKAKEIFVITKAVIKEDKAKEEK